MKYLTNSEVTMCWHSWHSWVETENTQRILLGNATSILTLSRPIILRWIIIWFVFEVFEYFLISQAFMGTVLNLRVMFFLEISHLLRGWYLKFYSIKQHQCHHCFMMKIFKISPGPLTDFIACQLCKQSTCNLKFSVLLSSGQVSGSYDKNLLQGSMSNISCIALLSSFWCAMAESFVCWISRTAVHNNERK